ncbi:hypothetical protein DL766_002398 [Monosporascus sp. MC13-8B]|uniref:Invertebrate defensins family profile domain-containing protein n=1 Tax=Monosporascus cannonballus TaxID=155416 RepID=A0ABY0HEP4_9PEZI|nr:hypothetical protein DL762_001979 [Monosporascus cannonballus]RYO97103.1 hypothetical protein DL763_002893 [Monosporascus cannonballus]RYP35665.1 hypothetical protein DL766_002398 [Monosporascus sp. MC13-8B]
MKLGLTILIASLGSAVFAAPATSEANDNVGLTARADNCFYPSHCSATWYGKCENHCGKRGFSHMSKNNCGWFKKRCCCIKP